MGRWSHRKRMGGGPPTTAVGVTRMIQAIIDDVDISLVAYSTPVVNTAFTPSDFASLPSAETGSTVDQSAGTELRITWSGIITGDTSVQYSGTDPPALTPQTIAYT